MNRMCFLAMVAIVSGAAIAQELSKFTPLSHGKDNTEDRTGLWFCPEYAGVNDILPLRKRIYATRESVTGGVAMRVDVKAGSKGVVTFENSPYPPDTSGITLYAKASSDLRLAIKDKFAFDVSTKWRKIDISWEQLGTTRDKPDIGYLFKIGLAAPAPADIWYIVDRLGCEGPEFNAHPEIAPEFGPDHMIGTQEILGNAGILAPTVARLNRKQPFKIVAFGDSVTAGTQAQRANWSIGKSEVGGFLYFSHLARLLEERYGYKGILPVQKGYGGWTSERARTVVKEALAETEASDVVIIQFGANDLGWAKRSVEAWIESMRHLVSEAKGRTSQIIVMSPTTGGRVPTQAEKITREFRAFAESENVAWVDITRWSMYRGEKFAWAYLANSYHPDFMGHIMIAELMDPLFSGRHFEWPPYVAQNR